MTDVGRSQREESNRTEIDEQRDRAMEEIDDAWAESEWFNDWLRLANHVTQ